MSPTRFRFLILGVLVVLCSGLLGAVRWGWTLLGQDPPAWVDDVRRIPRDFRASPLAQVGFGVGVVLIGWAAWPRRRPPRPPANAP